MKIKEGREVLEHQEYEILSIHVGRPHTYEFDGKQVETAIVKEPVGGPVYLSRTNFEGDGQADLIHHGGVDKAVCVYPADHYMYWESVLKRKLPEAAFGENVTVKGLTEKMCASVISSSWGGSCSSQPAAPALFQACQTAESKDMVLQVRDTGFSGFYFRVLEEGIVAPDSGLQLVSRDAHEATVSYANHLMYHDRGNHPAIRKILEVEALSESWRSSFLKELSA